MNPEVPDCPVDWETVDGAEWAQSDAGVGVEYAGLWVVARPGRIVASGKDPEVVRAEAAASLGRDPRALMVCAITHPDQWITDA
jgi:hypothetical protein